MIEYKEAVLKDSKGKFKLVANQDEKQLLLAMRDIYKSKARNLPDQIVRQVKCLNKLTVEYVIPSMITNIKQYYSYKLDVENPRRRLLPLPENVNNAGRKTLPAQRLSNIYNI
mgnify:CR=1 FL=1